MTIIKKYFSAEELKVLLYIFAAALAFRIFFIAETHNTSFFTHLYSDSQIYDNWAKDIAGGGTQYGGEVFFMAPAYPYFLAFFYWLFGGSILPIRLIQALISSLTIFTVFLSARNLFSRKAGYIAAAITAAHSIFIFYSGVILSETLQVFVVSVLLVFLTKKESTTRDWFIAGLLIGIAALFRGNILLLVPVIILYEFFKKKRDKKSFAVWALLFFVGVLIPIIPVTIRNYVVGDDFVLLTSNGGINFFLGNNHKSPGVFVSPDEFDISQDMSGRRYAESVVGYQLSPSQASDYWFKRGLTEIMSRPLGYLELELKKSALFFGEAENPQSVIMNEDYFAREYSNILKLPLIGFFPISLLAIFGVFLFGAKWKENPALLIYIISGTIASILFFVNGRFRMFITPALIIIASGTILEILKLLYENKYDKLKIPAAAVSLFVLAYFLVVNIPKFNDYDAYFYLGKTAMEEKDYNSAIDYFNKSLIYRDYYKTYVNLGNALALKKDYKSAYKIYDIAIEKNPSDYLAYFDKGLAYTQEGDMDAALKNYNKVIELNPGFDGVYRNIGIIYYVGQKYDKALLYFKKFISLTKDDELKSSVQYDIDRIMRIKNEEKKSEEKGK